MGHALNIARLQLRRYAPLVLACGIVLGLFEFAITGVVATFDVPAMLVGMMAMLPKNISSAMELVFGGLTPTGLIGFGWDHPIAHAAGTAVAVTLGARVVAGEIESGTLELVLAQPLSRVTYMLAHIAFSLTAIAVVCVLGMAGTIAGSRVFDAQVVTVAALAGAAINFGLLLCAFYTVTLLASASAREGGRALAIGTFVAVVSFFARTVALLWRDASFLEPFSLHTYYHPRSALETGHIVGMSLAVLVPFGVLLALLALQRFVTRDVP